MTVGWLPAPVEELFGPEATAEESYEVLTVDVRPAAWVRALETARDSLNCTYFDWLSAVDEPGTGFRVAAHVVALSPVRRLLVRTTVPHSAPVLATAVSVYAGAGWHERETHEMFGVTFEGHPGLDPLLLPEGFEGHPLRKDFVLAARVAKAWPGAKEPGESDHGGPKRRQMLPPGVPDPNEWGPLKGQLPPAPARPARGAARAAGDRPVRRARTAGEGSASQAPAGGGTEAGPATAGTDAAAGAQAPTPPRRARSAGQGSASQRTEAPAAEQQATPTTPDAPGPTEPTPPVGPRRTRSASQGSATQRTQSTAPPAPTEPTASTEPTPATEPTPSAEPSTPVEPSALTGQARPAASRSSDAPWHHARPAFDEPKPEPKPEPGSESEPGAGSKPDRGLEGTEEPEATAKPPASPDSDSGADPDSTPTPEDSTPEDSTPEDSTPEDSTPEDPTPRNPAGGTQ
ncbi:NADH-quinone oxidoreductase subunit C [Streptomyces sp. NBC_01340]|uniref:NADH-quinone oxidoreductase subunit C n=1 Tax=Streptomyces sp. NBC_01340 TaxID=2903830 RepID=UPI002E1105A6|nr:NADH-quinone oxidoreductase subunit C [Streptomyces sp. NBC_01340]